MNVRFPLFAKILLWLLMNLGILAAVFLAVCGAQFRFGLDSLLAGRAADRIRALSQAVCGDLQNRPREEWDAALERVGAAYGMPFALFRRDGQQVAGVPVALPPEVHAKLIERRGPGAGGRFEPGADAPPQPRFLLQTAQPKQVWIGVCVSLFEPDQPRPLTLLLMPASLRAGGLLFDLSPWAAAGAGALLLCVLFWIPLARHLTGCIAQITGVTEEIANGRFDARVACRRTDELGRLAQAVNRMAERLSHFVSGQKRFLGDVAHELGSPLARMEMALGVLEDRVGTGEIEDAREEVEHMSKLVHELLSFSRASLEQAVKLRNVGVAELVREVLEREAAPASSIAVNIDPALAVRADPELLSRALANLVRNALRHAAAGGPIAISADSSGTRVAIRVADGGPGVPEELIQRVFDPFFRAEASRSRETGGTGLGLAIVKTCVEACQGTVSARNRKPAGFEVEMSLESGERSEPSRRIS